MKQKHNIDALLSKKLANHRVEYNDAYWEEAQKLIAAKKKKNNKAIWFLSSLIVLASATLFTFYIISTPEQLYSFRNQMPSPSNLIELQFKDSKNKQTLSNQTNTLESKTTYNKQAASSKNQKQISASNTLLNKRETQNQAINHTQETRISKTKNGSEFSKIENREPQQETPSPNTSDALNAEQLVLVHEIEKTETSNKTISQNKALSSLEEIEERDNSVLFLEPKFFAFSIQNNEDKEEEHLIFGLTQNAKKAKAKRSKGIGLIASYSPTFIQTKINENLEIQAQQSFSLGLSAEMQVYKRFWLVSGIAYARHQYSLSQLDFNTETKQSIITENMFYWDYFQNQFTRFYSYYMGVAFPDTQLIVFTDSTLESRIDTNFIETIDTVNFISKSNMQLSYVEIPIVFSYRFMHKRWGLNMDVGTTIAFASSAQFVQLRSNENNFSKEEIRYNNAISLYGVGSLSAVYFYNTNWQLRFGAHYKIPWVSHFQPNTQFSEKVRLGGHISLMYCW
jgi:hypothetical protein